MAIAPPRPKGPHLNALRAFEAAARLGSFTAAAEELSVTPGAITQHIKSIEAWTETRLFQRNARGVTLTPLAQELLPDFTRAFDQLGLAVHALRTKAAPRNIRLATLPSIAQLWLAPRLGLLRRAAPDISVSVVALETPPNLNREPFDISLFFSKSTPEENEIEILQDRIFPVCTPEIAARLSSVNDLAGETLLHDSAWSEDWPIWLASQATVGDLAPRSIVHSLFAVALEEARHGGGVLMAHEALVEGAMVNGDLVCPFTQVLDLPDRLLAKTNPHFAGTDSHKTIIDVLTGLSEGKLDLGLA